MLIDSHAHLDFEDYKDDLGEVIARANKAGVTKIINVGADLERSHRAIKIAEKYPNIWATVGIHPEDAVIEIDGAVEKMEKLIKLSKKVVAVGECGLDYFYDGATKQNQEKLFETQINLAKKLNLPLVVHIRNGNTDEAARTSYKLLEKLKVESGVVHCFTLDKVWARKFLDIGFYLGFTGIVTYKNATIVHETVKIVPLERLLIETDAPYLAPQSKRGQRNEPSYIVEIAKKIAEIKNVSFDKVTKITSENASKLFGI